MVGLNRHSTFITDVSHICHLLLPKPKPNYVVLVKCNQTTTVQQMSSTAVAAMTTIIRKPDHPSVIPTIVSILQYPNDVHWLSPLW